MANIGVWDTSLFTSGSSAAQLDDELRSLMSQVRVGASEFARWPSSGSTDRAGEPLLGTARLGITSSEASLDINQGDGFLLWDDTRKAIYHVGIAAHGPIAHSLALDGALGPDGNKPTRVSGSFSINTTTGINSVSFPILGLSFSTTSNLVIIQTPSSASFYHCIDNVSVSGFSSFVSYADSGTTPAATIYWMAEGEVA